MVNSSCSDWSGSTTAPFGSLSGELAVVELLLQYGGSLGTVLVRCSVWFFFWLVLEVM